jgi:hypothetical protein
VPHRHEVNLPEVLPHVPEGAEERDSEGVLGDLHDDPAPFDPGVFSVSVTITVFWHTCLGSTCCATCTSHA